MINWLIREVIEKPIFYYVAYDKEQYCELLLQLGLSLEAGS